MPVGSDISPANTALSLDIVTTLLTARSLAMVELYIVLAVLYRPGGLKLELFETQESDVTPAHDFLIPLPRLKSTGIKVVLHEGDDRESKCN